MLPYHGEVGGGHFVAERKGLLEFVVGGQSVFVRGRRGRERVAGYVCKVSKFIRDSQVFCDIFFRRAIVGCIANCGPQKNALAITITITVRFSAGAF